MRNRGHPIVLLDQPPLMPTLHYNELDGDLTPVEPEWQCQNKLLEQQDLDLFEAEADLIVEAKPQPRRDGRKRTKKRGKRAAKSNLP